MDSIVILNLPTKFRLLFRRLNFNQQQMILRYISIIVIALCAVHIQAQEINKFEQLGNTLPTPNETRSASGAPGHKYWQQKADYLMDIYLDDKKQLIKGKETITYHNQSPDALTYLWLQLDQNNKLPDADGFLTQTGELDTRVTAGQLNRFERNFDRGYHIEKVMNTQGTPLPFTINKTMMRVDLPQPLMPGKSYSFKIEWWFN